MTTKTIDTYVAGGYVLSPAYSRLVITAAGGIGGTGLVAGSYAKILNRGVIRGRHGSDGIDLNAGGLVQNGAANHTSALIEGHRGVVVSGGAGSVVNFGTIEGGVNGSPAGVYLSAGGAVTNGSQGDITAQILGYRGVYISGGPGMVQNFGTITGEYSSGVKVATGVVVNGIPSNESALIQSIGLANGVSVGSGAVTNFGTIACTQNSTAVLIGFLGDGAVTNGSAADIAATIQGGRGVYLFQYGTVTNFGTILATRGDSGGIGVEAQGFYGAGTVMNGSAADRAALISGYVGVQIGYGVVVNYGNIIATGAGGLSYGIRLNGGAAATNFGTISGYVGVYGAFNDTVTNFGTIEGTGGPAVVMHQSDLLVVEAGCAFLGGVEGFGATLELANGSGTLGLSHDIDVGGAVTVSGSMAPTTFSNFGRVEIGAAATFAASGHVTIGAHESVIDFGALILYGRIANSGVIEAAGAGTIVVENALANANLLFVDGGTLTVSGAVSGAGGCLINAGRLEFESSFNQNVTFIGTTGALQLARSQDYSGTIAGFSKSGGTSLDLDDIAFVSAGEATFSGTKTGGVLTVTDGTHTANITLIGDYRASTFVAASDGHGGTIVRDPPAAAGWTGRFVAAMAGLGGGGGGALASDPEPWRSAPAMLARPTPAPA